MNRTCLNGLKNCNDCSREKLASFHTLQIRSNENNLKFETKESIIIFLQRGCLLLSYNFFIGKVLSAGEMILIPSESSVEISCMEDATALCLSIQSDFWIRENYELKSLTNTITIVKDDYYPFSIHERIKRYISFIEETIRDKDLCHELSYMGAKTIILLIYQYYKNNEVATFFSPIIGRDTLFKESVLKFYKEVRSAKELAQKMNYSPSAFQVRFEKSFSMPVYKWMQYQRARSVLNDFIEGTKTIKGIGMSNHFSTTARFYDFCKKRFDMTPKQIQNKLDNGEKVHILP